MANNVNNAPPGVPWWPFGGARSVRDRLVDPRELDRKRKARTGDPKNPPLASAELVDWIEPQKRSSDDLRLPLPPLPEGHDADIEEYLYIEQLGVAAERAQSAAGGDLERALTRVSAPPERIERLRALLAREEKMAELVKKLHVDMREIRSRMYHAQKDEGF